MPRLYLTLVFIAFSQLGFSQNMLGKYLDFAKEQADKGDYIYAITYYEKAMEIDSNSVAILWQYAESLRGAKDYQKARFYYKKVYEKEESAIFPMSLLWWGLMEKQCGNYTEAIEIFKRAKKKYAKDKRGYNYLKSKRELESCLWASSAKKDTSNMENVILPEGLNTVNSEFGHTIHDGKFILSSMRSEKEGPNEEMLDASYRNRIYNFPLTDSTKNKAELLPGMDQLVVHYGNGSFSLDGKRFYFSKCEGTTLSLNCQIWVCAYANGKWGNPTNLGDIINEAGTTNTTPVIATVDNEEWLIFSSNRTGGKGGMDLFFSVIKNNGNQFGKVKPLNSINSIDQEIAPFFDYTTKRLYFSSNWYDGFGGFDVYYSQLNNNRWEDPVNVGLPINSPANDLYFFKNGDTSYVSSNRVGVKYVKNPTCCSDIFAFHPPILIVPETKKETLASLNKRLPVTLYFHNDVPDPRSRENTTKVNYINAYNDYIAMLPEYRKEYAKGLSGDKIQEAEEDIESFFLQYVEQGVKDLQLFETLLQEELEKGLRIRLNVRGFASPLAKTEYNVALTNRRIQSLRNYLMVVKDGVFKPYLEGTAENGGKLEIAGVPFGEYTANQITSDNPNDTKNSVYSRSAAIERKIEIQSVSYLETDSLFFLIDLSPSVLTLGKIQGAGNKTSFSIFNNGTSNLQIDRIECAQGNLKFSYDQDLKPKLSTVVRVEQIGDFPTGIFSQTILIYVKGFELPIKILFLAETI